MVVLNHQITQVALPLLYILIGRDARWFLTAERRMVNKDFVIQARAHCRPIVAVKCLLKATDQL